MPEVLAHREFISSFITIYKSELISDNCNQANFCTHSIKTVSQMEAFLAFLVLSLTAMSNFIRRVGNHNCLRTPLSPNTTANRKTFFKMYYSKEAKLKAARNAKLLIN